jgi:imidazole glycerol-phosphate synthase subunit HisH
MPFQRKTLIAEFERESTIQMKNVAIIDYKISNLFSVNQACIHAGLSPVITSDKLIIEKADGIILPGVGSFKEAMNNLSDLDLCDSIRKVINEDKPFMGICLGYQVLFSESEEFGHTDGLNIFSGQVKKFENRGNKLLKIPQVGWNTINPYNEEKWNNSLLKGIDPGEYTYFVHSYYVDTQETEIALTSTNYEGTNYCSSIQSKNVFASQYHPEKSGLEGLRIYKNFEKMITRIQNEK